MNVWPKQSRITTLRIIGCSFVSIYLQFCERTLRDRRKLCLLCGGSSPRTRQVTAGSNPRRIQTEFLAGNRLISSRLRIKSLVKCCFGGPPVIGDGDFTRPHLKWLRRDLLCSAKESVRTRAAVHRQTLGVLKLHAVNNSTSRVANLLILKLLVDFGVRQLHGDQKVFPLCLFVRLSANEKPPLANLRPRHLCGIARIRPRRHSSLRRHASWLRSGKLSGEGILLNNLEH